MNIIRKAVGGPPLTPEELAKEANAITKRSPFTKYDFIGLHSRVAGDHCYCCGNGDFVLLPTDDPGVISGGKRYMKCSKCGGWSHL